MHLKNILILNAEGRSRTDDGAGDKTRQPPAAAESGGGRVRAADESPAEPYLHTKSGSSSSNVRVDKGAAGRDAKKDSPSSVDPLSMALGGPSTSASGAPSRLPPTPVASAVIGQEKDSRQEQRLGNELGNLFFFCFVFFCR